VLNEKLKIVDTTYQEMRSDLHKIATRSKKYAALMSWTASWKSVTAITFFSFTPKEILQNRTASLKCTITKSITELLNLVHPPLLYIIGAGRGSPLTNNSLK